MNKYFSQNKQLLPKFLLELFCFSKTQNLLAGNACGVNHLIHNDSIHEKINTM